MYLLAKNLSAKSPFAVFQAAQHLSDDVAKQPHRKEEAKTNSSMNDMNVFAFNGVIN